MALLITLSQCRRANESIVALTQNQYANHTALCMCVHSFQSLTNMLACVVQGGLTQPADCGGNFFRVAIKSHVIPHSVTIIWIMYKEYIIATDKWRNTEILHKEGFLI